MDKTNTEAKEKVLGLLKGTRVGMMATRHDDGTMHSRPMATNHTEFDGQLWYLTDINSEKVADIRRHPEVLIAYADPGKNDFVSVTGRAEIVTDRARIEELWSEPARVWFPKGVDDPDLSAIKVEVDHAEYWDGGSNAMILIYGYAKSLLTGERPDNEGETGRAEF